MLSVPIVMFVSHCMLMNVLFELLLITKLCVRLNALLSYVNHKYTFYLVT